jgi:hypothetical protein
VEWPELLRAYTEALRQYTLWMERGCVGAPPALVDATGVRGPVPGELRVYATELVAETAAVRGAIAGQLSTLRASTGKKAPAHDVYDHRPMPRYLDALG